MAGMLRHDSGSIISSLQNYGDSDEEETDPTNKSTTSLPFEAQSRDEQQPQEAGNTPTTGDNTADEGIEFTAKPSPSPSEGRPQAETEDTNTAEQTEDTGVVVIKIGEDKDEQREETVAEVSPAALISDDEGDDGKHSKKSGLEDAVRDALGDKPSADSPASQGSVTKPGRQAARLVSYGADEDVDEDETSSEEEDEESPAPSPETVAADNSALSRSVQNMSSDEIQIPPEPPGKCSPALQKKIEDSLRRDDYDLNRIIQSKKHFRNPSIYEKLIDFCHIDEKGTNFPPELYDPHIWGKDSMYDELDKAQRKDMERREKEKKERTKIEFLTGTKKSSGDNSNLGPSDEKRRKTKWDAQPSAGINIQVSKLPSAQHNPGVVNLTATVTGTKATVIPAAGSLSKKSSSSSGK